MKYSLLLRTCGYFSLAGALLLSSCEGHAPAGSPFTPTSDRRFFKPLAATLGETVAVANYAGNSVVEFDPLAAPKVAATVSVLQAYDAAFGLDGNLYVSSDASNTVTVLAPDGTRVRSISGLQSPRSVTFDAKGDLYVGTFRTIEVYKPGTDKPDRSITNVGIYPKVAVDAKGDLYAVGYDSSKPTFVLYAFAPGKDQPAWTIDLRSNGDAFAIITDSSNNVYLAQYALNRVTLYSPDGTQVRTIAAGISRPSARRVAADPRGSIAVSSLSANAVVLLKQSGSAPLRTLTGGVDTPASVAFDAAGNEYVANSASNTVSVYAPGQKLPAR